LDRFDIDMAGCIECALCVEACPFRAITMAPDFEMAATYARTTDLVYDMYQLRIAGTAEIDAGMEHIQGVKRGLRGQATPAASPARPAAAAAAPARPGAVAATPARPAAAAAGAGAAATPAGTAGAAGVAGVAGAAGAAEPAGATPAAATAAPPPATAAPAAAAPADSTAPAPAADVPTDYDPLTISDEDLKKLPPAERGKVYRARNMARGIGQPPNPR
jgi:ferredoxin